MLLSTQTSVMQSALGFKNAVDLFSEVGYDALDFSFTDSELTKDLSDEFFRDLKKYAAEKGLTFNQVHAPFPSSASDEDFTKNRFHEIITSIKHASILGVKNIVVHPCHHIRYADDGAPERLFEINMEFYSRLKPYCEEYGIRVALENMWQRIAPNKISHSTCSRPEEFIKYLDTLNSNCFTACLDIGHMILCCQDPADFIRALGKKRLGALHVHDVDGINDLHTLPYMGICDWDKVVKALAEIGYEGDFTYEADGFYKNKPKELYKQYQITAVQTGRFLIKKAEEYKIKKAEEYKS